MGGASSTKNVPTFPKSPGPAPTTPELRQILDTLYFMQKKKEEATKLSTEKLEVSKEQLDMFEKLKPLLEILATNKSSTSELDFEELYKIELVKPYIEGLLVKEKVQVENLETQKSVHKNAIEQNKSCESTTTRNTKEPDSPHRYVPNSAEKLPSSTFNQGINHRGNAQQASLFTNSDNQQNALVVSTTLEKNLTGFRTNQNNAQEIFHPNNLVGLSNMDKQRFPHYQTNHNIVPQHIAGHAVPLMPMPLISSPLLLHQAYPGFPQQPNIQNQNFTKREPQYHHYYNNTQRNHRPIRYDSSGAVQHDTAQNNTPARNTGAIPKRYNRGGHRPPLRQAGSRSANQGQRSVIDSHENSSENNFSTKNKPTENCKDDIITNNLFDKNGKPPAFSNKNKNKVKNINNDNISSLEWTNESKNITFDKTINVNEEKTKPKKKKPQKKKIPKIPKAQVDKIYENFVTINSESKVCQDKKSESMKVSATDAKIVTNLVSNLKIYDPQDFSKDVFDEDCDNFNEVKRQQTMTPGNMKTFQTLKNDENNHISGKKTVENHATVPKSELELTHNAQRHLQACQSYFDTKISNVFSTSTTTSKHESKLSDVNYPESTQTHHLRSEELRGLLPKYWHLKNFSYNFGHIVVPLEASSSNFQYVSGMFLKTVKNNMKIEKISRLENVFSWLMFCLKKQEMTTMLGYQPHERNLFHGTRYDITTVIEHSLNWRLVDPKHKGVTFSPLASTMVHQCGGGMVKHMILARVLIGRKTVGNDDTVVPPPNFNTLERADGKVIYKYDDYTSYPEYLITFKGRLRVKQQKAAMGNSDL